MKRIIVGFLAVAFLSGCGWYRNCNDSRSYKLGEEITSTVGSPIIQTGCYSASYEPRGLNQRQPQKDEYFTPLLESELIYSGREGNTLHVTYREYTFNQSYDQIARSPFFQQLYYDLGASKSIVFQDWIIDVIESTNQHIKFKVVKEPVRREPFELFNYGNR